MAVYQIIITTEYPNALSCSHFLRDRTARVHLLTPRCRLVVPLSVSGARVGMPVSVSGARIG